MVGLEGHQSPPPAPHFALGCSHPHQTSRAPSVALSTPRDGAPTLHRANRKEGTFPCFATAAHGNEGRADGRGAAQEESSSNPNPNPTPHIWVGTSPTPPSAPPPRRLPGCNERRLPHGGALPASFPTSQGYQSPGINYRCHVT